MKMYVSRPETTLVDRWDGGQDEQIVSDLRKSGWTVMFQEPAPGQQAQSFIAEKSEWIPVPARPRMIIIGPYRQQVFTIDSGQEIHYYEGTSYLSAQTQTIVDGSNWSELTPADEPAWPTPQQLLALQDHIPDFS